MDDISVLTSFLTQAREDPRLGPLHITLYAAIYFWWVRQGCVGMVEVNARDLMPIAKIVGGTPFYRSMKQLHKYGYIVYEPSFNPAVKSRISLVLAGKSD